MSTRDQFIETTSRLLEAQGYHATGLNQIINDSGAPKGSLYYHFPDGKEGLAAAAVERTGAIVAQRVKGGLTGTNDASSAIRSFIQVIAQNIEESGFTAGGPLTIVAMETATSSERLNQTCRAAYQQIQDEFATKLLASGFTRRRATQLALFITATIEGGIMLSRTMHSGDPLRRVADEVGRLLDAEQL